jgi:hypothetical protein
LFEVRKLESRLSYNERVAEYIRLKGRFKEAKKEMWLHLDNNI